MSHVKPHPDPTDPKCLTVFGNWFIFRCQPSIVAIGPAGETACPTLLDQSFGEVGGAGGFACRWKLISIAHPNPEKRLCESESAQFNPYFLAPPVSLRRSPISLHSASRYKAISTFQDRK